MKQETTRRELNNPLETLPHDLYFENLVEREYSRLIKTNQIYLDYTGGNLYAESQIRKHHELLETSVFGNPHSTNPTSQLATRLVEESREKVLDFFNAREDYYCVFTSNASGALKIVGECYPFDSNSQILLLADNHNSVNGIREYAANKGANFAYCPIQFEDLCINDVALTVKLKKYKSASQKLFAYPAQSNVSGVKHDLEWIYRAHQEGWDVLLDSAAFVPTNPLDLSSVKPDYVSVSFYKIFGYPTGMGCLLVKKSKFDKLVKPWFAGGTVTLASAKTRHHYLANNHERFENGTVNYLDIPAIKIGLDHIENVGLQMINERVTGLMDYLVSGLSDLQHENGKPLVKVFGPADRKNSGGTIIINVFNENGNKIPFEKIESKMNENNVSIRSGCFCNPGIDEVNNCLTTEELTGYFTSRDCGSYYDMVKHLNKMRGATRISVGIATRKSDIDFLLKMIASYSYSDQLALA